MTRRASQANDLDQPSANQPRLVQSVPRENAPSMGSAEVDIADRDARARHVLALLAVDPAGLGGAVLVSAPSHGRDTWIAAFQLATGSASKQRRIPLSVTHDRLCGGLDLASTLSRGRPVMSPGLLAEADGGTIILASAERLAPLTVSAIVAAIDGDGPSGKHSGGAPSCFATIALDESTNRANDPADADERVAEALADRLAFRLDADAINVLPAGFVLGLEDFGQPGMRSAGANSDDEPINLFDTPDADDIAAARARLHDVTVPDRVIAGLTATAYALGIASIRASLLAVKAARAAAALDGRDEANDDDARLAAALVLAHRATQLPADPTSDDDAPPDAPPEGQPEEQPEQAPEQQAEPPGDQTEQSAKEAPPDNGPSNDAEPPDMLIAAAKAAIPAGLLAQLQSGSSASRTQNDAARSGASRNSLRRGRPATSRPGDPRRGGRLDLVATLRRAAPWQTIRRAERVKSDTQNPEAQSVGTKRDKSSRLGVNKQPASKTKASKSTAPARIEVRRDDLVVRRYEEKSGTLLIFAVDASGSAALSRLAEAKGAVELLLADCYARRDEVAVVAFRGTGAELLLPPTRALARAKRALAQLPGGGATPLAAALDAARDLAAGARRKGRQPAVVLLTDGRANVARDGRTGRTVGEADAHAAAAQLRISGVPALVIDTSDRPQPQASQLAAVLGARFLALPRADATKLSAAVRAGLPGA